MRTPHTKSKCLQGQLSLHYINHNLVAVVKNIKFSAVAMYILYIIFCCEWILCCKGIFLGKESPAEQAMVSTCCFSGFLFYVLIVFVKRFNISFVATILTSV